MDDREHGERFNRKPTLRHEERDGWLRGKHQERGESERRVEVQERTEVKTVQPVWVPMTTQDIRHDAARHHPAHDGFGNDRG